MRNWKKTLAMILLSVLTASLYTQADIKLPAVIGDNMVVQQGGKVRFWGWADAGESVSLHADWTDASFKTTTNDEGDWQVKIPAPPAGGPYALTVKGKNTLTISNILSGEVWIASGQSNMEWSMNRSENAEKHIAGANHPNIRLFSLPHIPASEPRDDCEGNWLICTPETVESFTAVGYFFGRDIHKSLDVPVGIIKTAWGGTPAQAWTRKAYLADNKELSFYLTDYEQLLREYPEKLADYEKKLAVWKTQAQQAKAQDQKPPRRPRAPRGPLHQHNPSVLYNGMIAPLTPYTIRGAIWYQGESNVGRAEVYHTLFSTMIENWRDDWRQGQFPFLFVQIAPYKNYGNPDLCARLQESQLLTHKFTPNTGMVVVSDIGNIHDIHPRNKLDVGKRLARWALADTYHKSMPVSGPLYSHYLIEDDKIRVFFDHTDQGLVCAGDTLKHFTIAGADKSFHPAHALIDGESVVVFNPEISDPRAVRYAWTNDAIPNFFNGVGLPASMFRTDEW